LLALLPALWLWPPGLLPLVKLANPLGGTGGGGGFAALAQPERTFCAGCPPPLKAAKLKGLAATALAAFGGLNMRAWAMNVSGKVNDV